MAASLFASVQNTHITTQKLLNYFVFRIAYKNCKNTNSLTRRVFVPFFFPPQGQRASECELGEWSQWSTCMKKNKTCGFRKGSQSRFRGPLLQAHSPDTTSPASVPSQTCSPQTERRKCTVTKIPCARGKRVTRSFFLSLKNKLYSVVVTNPRWPHRPQASVNWEDHALCGHASDF